ncbi:MAG: ABC transporter [Candidatus Tectimicrobiota bacterium]|nr:MAG: ABC transporter [Candidatus Tectomicrobia bacterium]
MAFLQLKGLAKRYRPHEPPAVEDLSFGVAQGEIVALLGPSGCGKTTTLRLIAGFERPDAGSVELGGTLLVDRHRFVPPERRGVGMVFQDFALFPHLTVAANVAFGLRRLDAAARAARVEEMLALVELTALARRYPHELSSGQQQRVALARALAPRPAVLLLDEPFSNLDARLRWQMLHEVRALLRRLHVTALFVTHDQEEAFALADRVGVMQQGRLEQLDTPEALYYAPRTRFVASFVGPASFLPGQVTGGGILTELGTFPNDTGLSPGARVEVMLRPDALHLRPHPQGQGRVVARHFRGPFTLVEVQLPSGARLQAALSGTGALPSRVHVEVDPQRAVAFPCA